jgi:hypothetical protein
VGSPANWRRLGKLEKLERLEKLEGLEKAKGAAHWRKSDAAILAGRCERRGVMFS